MGAQIYWLWEETCFKILCVQIPAPDIIGLTFFRLFCCKICIVCLNDWKWMKKRWEMALFKNIREILQNEINILFVVLTTLEELQLCHTRDLKIFWQHNKTNLQIWHKNKLQNSPFYIPIPRTLVIVSLNIKSYYRWKFM